MHRFILDAPDGIAVDHVNGNGLDNRKANLRLASSSQNAIHRMRRNPAASSKYRGVTLHKGLGKWQAKAVYEGASIYLGVFVLEEEAAKAYDEFAIEHFGEFAVLNFPNREHLR